MDTVNPGFSNELVDTRELPRFEAVPMTPLHPDYWKVTLIGLGIFFLVAGAALGSLIYYNPQLQLHALWLWAGWGLLLIISADLSRVAFLRKGYAFREHDVLFKSGVISITTTVIPYNRVQHVALHEGFFSRQYHLAEIRVFTAGGSGSELEIPGIPKSQAEDIKQLLMGKIKTAL